MKKNLLYILLILLIITGNYSCNRTEADLFDKSPAERMNEYISSVQTLFQSAENGWIVDYFPNPDSVGYTYLMKFTSPFKVTMATKNVFVPQYTEEESEWDIIGDMGTILTFNTYNNIFHLFADPVRPGAVEVDGVGLNGDYEFMVLNKSNEKITLKGKKHGAISIARPLPVGQNWEAYLNGIDELNSYLFGFDNILQLLQNNEEKFSLKNGYSHIFTFIPFGGNEIDDAFLQSFKTTDYGIRFAQPVEIDKEKVQDFRFNENKSKLIAIENESVTIVPPELVSYMATTQSDFFATKENTTGVDALFDQLKAEFISGFNANYELESIGFGYYKAIEKPCLVLKTKNRVIGYFAIPLTFADGKATIANFDANNFPTADMNPNARTFYQRIPSIKTLLALLPGTYNLETDDFFALRTVKYTKSDNSLSLTVSR